MTTITLDFRCLVTDAPEGLLSELRRTFSFPNPEIATAERLGRWTGGMPDTLHFWEAVPGGLAMPRGAAGLVISIARQHAAVYLNDQRRILPEVDFRFAGELRPYQQLAVDAALKRDSGTIEAPTGSGKTVLALALIAARRQPALVIVHTRELADQWRDRAEAFLGLDRAEIGIVGDGKYRIGPRVTIALVQSLYQRAAEVSRHIGHLVVDECHHCPSRTFTDAVTALDCRYMLGLSATPYRRDGLGKLIGWHLGPRVARIDPAELEEIGAIMPFEVHLRETSFCPCADPTNDYAGALSELEDAQARNELIAADVAAEAERCEGVALVLSDRRAHLMELAEILSYQHWLEPKTLIGTMPTGARRAVVDSIQKGGSGSRVLLATSQLIGEGFDCPGLTSLFLCTPIRFSGRLLQAVGRVLRPAPGKKRPRVYDYVDAHPVFQAAARSRQREYAKRGATVINTDAMGVAA